MIEPTACRRETGDQQPHRQPASSPAGMPAEPSSAAAATGNEWMPPGITSLTASATICQRVTWRRSSGASHIPRWKRARVHCNAARRRDEHAETVNCVLKIRIFAPNSGYA